MLEKIDVPIDKVYAWLVGMTAQFRSHFLPESEMLQEPNETENAPVVLETLKVHKAARKFNSQGVVYTEFYMLSKESKPYFTQYYRNEYVDENKGAHCSGCYGEPDMLEWLQCPICSSWFHEQCFHL